MLGEKNIKGNMFKKNHTDQDRWTTQKESEVTWNHNLYANKNLI